jgi:hypothetical protein
MYSVLNGEKSYQASIFVVGFFILLKVFTNYLVYNSIKYKDDGRDAVSFADYVAIHFTFPALNAFTTYLMIFVIF